MKKLTKAILAISASLMSHAAFGQFNDRSCWCDETERRIDGLESVLRYASISSQESNRIDYEISVARDYLYRANRSWDVNQQESLCSTANQYVDRSWVRWQPWVASNGFDRSVWCQ